MENSDCCTFQFKYICTLGSLARKNVQKKNTGFFVRKTVGSQNQTILVVLSSRMHHVLSVENIKSLIRDTKELVAFSNENLIGRD